MTGAHAASGRGGRTLIVGSTGFIGRFVAETNLALDRPTYLLIRSGPVSASKSLAITSLQDKGAIIIHGSINGLDLMKKVLEEYKIEIVISVVGGESILDQLHLIDAIKSVGTVKRFLPSEFGHDIDRADPVEPGLTMYNEKRKVRRAIEEAGIPHTYICCNSIAAWPYHDNTHPADVLPPLDRFHIYGDGSVKAYFVAGNDIGKFTIKSIEDARTINKSVHFQPRTNLLSVNELASIWEKKLGRTLPRVIITEDDLLAAAQEKRIPESIVASLTHDIFIKGCQINYTLDKIKDEEVTSLYPDEVFRSIDECFEDFLGKIVDTPVVDDKPTNEDCFVAQNPGREALALDDKPTNEDCFVAQNPGREALALDDKPTNEDCFVAQNPGREALAQPA